MTKPLSGDFFATRCSVTRRPLWVSKQHGHGPETMFRAYTARLLLSVSHATERERRWAIQVRYVPGEAQGNYDEFRFFTGLRPSEQIALLVDDCDLSQSKVKVSKACVMKRDKDRTKRFVEPRKRPHARRLALLL